MESMGAGGDTEKWLLTDRGYSYIILASAICVIYDHLLINISFLNWFFYLTGIGVSAVFGQTAGLQLTFHDEVEYVWRRPKFSVVQVLFFISRYGGDALQIYPAYIIVRHIMDDTVKVRNFVQVYIGYLGAIILCSTQGIMIYRVSCMYNHNRKIIFILATAFITELTSMIISQSIANNIHNSVPDPAPGVHICKQDSFPTWAYSIWIPILFHEAVLLLLATLKGISYYRSDTRGLLEDRNINGSAGHHSLMYILVRDSITFPLIGLVVCIVNLISWAGLPYLVAQMTFPFALFIPCILGSHLVINLREAYYQPFTNECDIQFVHDESGGSIEFNMP